MAGCSSNKRDSEPVDRKVEKLKNYHLLKQGEHLLLGLPIRLKYDDKAHHLFIQDVAQQKIIEIDDSSNIVHTFGKKGRGPGELLNIGNFFITPKRVFIVDAGQYLINKYSRRDGHYIASLDYGKYVLKKAHTSKHGAPPAPLIPWQDNNNKPFVTQNGMLLLPTQTSGKFLYQIINWKGDKLANIGAIPKEQAVLGKVV